MIIIIYNSIIYTVAYRLIMAATEAIINQCLLLALLLATTISNLETNMQRGLVIIIFLMYKELLSQHSCSRLRAIQELSVQDYSWQSNNAD